MISGLPDVLSGVWARSGSRTSAPPHGGRFFRAYEESARRGDPVLATAAWGINGTLDGLALAGDLRLDHRGELARRIGDGDPERDGAAGLFLRAWRGWGADCLREVEGDFAVAIWDPDAGELALARDAIGHRPLHFRSLPWGVAFASTPSSLACLTGPPAPDLDRLASLLAFVPELGRRSYFADVERVVPGHVLTVDRRGRIDHRRWWAPRLHPVPMSYGEAVEAMQAEIDRAVAAALETEAPVAAAQLSGGHDSSLVVATASRLLPPDRALVAITGEGSGEKAELPADAFDEPAIAAATAAMLPNVEHRFAVAEPESPLGAVDRWVIADQAILNPYSLGWLDRTYAVAKEAGAEVMLVGYSGNFTVSHGGAERFALLARSMKWRTLAREMKALRKSRGTSRAGLAGMIFGPWMPTWLWMLLANRRGRDVRRFDRRGFLRPDSARVRRALRFARSNRLNTAVRPPRQLNGELRFLGLKWADHGLFNHLVRGRYGVEVRDPLGARRVVELSLTLGIEHFARDGEGKRLSKALLRGRVAEQVYAEDTKRGMQSAHWLAGALIGHEQLVEEIERMAQDPELAALFDVERLRAKAMEWKAAGRGDAELDRAYRDYVTAAVVAGRWARKVRERDCAALLR